MGSQRGTRSSEDRYFEHGSDIGIRGSGTTIEEAFEHAAEATFAISCDPGELEPRETVAIQFREPDPELALVTWLNLLLGEARARGLALCRFSLRRDGDWWHGQAAGERWHPAMERGVEVKGATLTMLSLRRLAGRWEARCVVDV